MAIQKIVGIEQEYGIIPSSSWDLPYVLVGSYLRFLENKCKYIDRYADKRSIDDIISGRKFPDSMLPNGARYYVDHVHPEYSCPESSNAKEVVSCDKAGESILNDSVTTMKRVINRWNNTRVYKNNVDKSGNSYGCHENYMLDAGAYVNIMCIGKALDFLTSFLVTRQILCGSGKISNCYNISQRADFMRASLSLDTIDNRAIVNTRDEPHADPEKYRRLHLIVGDANMSEYSAYLKTGLTSMVLQMIEDNFIREDLAIRFPIEAIKSVSRDINLKNRISLTSGKDLTAIDIQRGFLDLARQYYDSNPQNKIEITDDLLEKWDYCLNGLEKLSFDKNGVYEDDPYELSRKIDWVIKKMLLDLKMTKENWSPDDPRLHKMDLEYHNINKEEGLYYMLEKEGEVERIIDDSAIKYYVENPPRNTRAYFRGNFIKKFYSSILSLDWGSINVIERGKQKTILLLDPFSVDPSGKKDITVLESFADYFSLFY